MHPASSQCMQLRLTKSQRTALVWDGTSLKRIMLNAVADRSGGFCREPVLLVFWPGSWFQDLHAVWQPLHPIQSSGEMSNAFLSVLSS